MIYNFEKNLNIAFEPEQKIETVQLLLLRQHLKYCLESSPYYKKRIKGIYGSIGSFTLNDFRKLPFTDKLDFVNNNKDFLAVDETKVVDISLSSGTTGVPAEIMYTENDLQRLAYNEKKSFLGCGITSDDKVLLTCTMDRCFIAGLAYFMGIRDVGASAVRNGLNSLESHLELIRKIRPTVIVGVPSFLYRMGEYVKEHEDNTIFESVNKLVCIGEPVKNRDLSYSGIALKLKTIWNADVYSTYASSEGVSTFCECSEERGGHLHPDLAIVEIIDDKNRNLPYGEIGEVVITPLQSTGMPLIRFKTGDISFLDGSKCNCGRNTPRLGPIIGRKQQMLKIQGTTLYPQAIYSVLDEIPEISVYCIEVRQKEMLSDDVEVYVSLKHDLSKDKLLNILSAKLRVKLKVTVMPENEIKAKVYSNESRKPVKFFDERRTPETY